MQGRPAFPLAEKLKKASMRTQPKGMFQRFTDRARRVDYLAQEEARLLHTTVGTEHLLLACSMRGGIAAKTLGSLGVSREEVRIQVEEIIGHTQVSRKAPSSSPQEPRRC
jgi:hypothetical protein